MNPFEINLSKIGNHQNQSFFLDDSLFFLNEFFSIDDKNDKIFPKL